MTAALIDELSLGYEVPAAAAPAPRLTLAPQPQPTTPSHVTTHVATHVATTRKFEPPSDPMADVAGHLLSIPLRHMYALLWRAGFIDVKS